jgi:hypothetical protein
MRSSASAAFRAGAYRVDHAARCARLALRDAGRQDPSVEHPRRFSVFDKVMVDAVVMELIARSPARGVTPPPDTKLDITVLTSPEVAQLAAAMPKWCRGRPTRG